MKPKLIALVVVIILILIFLIQNTGVVTLRIYFWKISMSQIILIPLAMAIGSGLGYFVAKFTGKDQKNSGFRRIFHFFKIEQKSKRRMICP